VGRARGLKINLPAANLWWRDEILNAQMKDKRALLAAPFPSRSERHSMCVCVSDATNSEAQSALSWSPPLLLRRAYKVSLFFTG